jgi:hypothetical protein
MKIRNGPSLGIATRLTSSRSLSAGFFAQLLCPTEFLTDKRQAARRKASPKGVVGLETFASSSQLEPLKRAFERQRSLSRLPGARLKSRRVCQLPNEDPRQVHAPP